MMMRRLAFAIVFVILSLPYFIFGRETDYFVLRSLFKSLPLIALSVSLVISSGTASDRTAIILCLIALFFSIAGDTFGELKMKGMRQTRLLLQLSSFSLAHICYIISFLRFKTKKSLWRNFATTLVLLVCAILYETIISGIDNSTLRIASSVYLLLIGGMVFSSIFQGRERLWVYICGSFLFLVSDSLLAYRLFVGPLLNAGILIMSTYYAAQLLLNINLINNNPNHKQL